jgi:hypothetical protein
MIDASADAEMLPFRIETRQADLDDLHGGLGRGPGRPTVLADDVQYTFRPLR